MKLNPNQFTTLPNNICKDTKIGISEVAVYLMCKRYMNQDSRESFPSYATLAQLCEMSKNKVIDCIHTLAEEGYIQIRKKEGRKSNFYYFPVEVEKNFSMIAYEFLFNEKLSAKEKGYLAIIQQYFYINKDERTGSVTISNRELCQLTKVSDKTISRIDKDLMNKEMLAVFKSNIRDTVTGIYNNTKLSNLEKTKQANTLLAEDQEAIKNVMAEMFNKILTKMSEMEVRLNSIEEKKLPKNEYKF